MSRLVNAAARTATIKNPEKGESGPFVVGWGMLETNEAAESLSIRGSREDAECAKRRG
jgi:hypothetical protein